MDPLPKWAQRLAALVGLLVGMTALVTFIVNYSSAKNDLDAANRELVAEKERNRRAFSLLERSTAEGRIDQSDLVEYLSKDDATSIVQGAGRQIVASTPFPLETQFFPSGWMGDGVSGTIYLSVRKIAISSDTTAALALEIRYSEGPKGWAGMYWQYPDGNWGDQPGKSLVGARGISFKARGERGGEIVEFKSGGIRDRRYADTYEVSLGAVALTASWKEYRIDLSQEDLSSVIGAFAWSASSADNNGELHFYLADLVVW
jgi:hypothetical protein